MKLPRETTIGLLDVVRRGRLGKAENLIIVALDGSHSEGIGQNVLATTGMCAAYGVDPLFARGERLSAIQENDGGK